MNKIIKSNVFWFFIGAFLFGTIGVFASQIFASDITFVPNNSSWEVNNIDDALNDLYDKADSNGNTYNLIYSSGGNGANLSSDPPETYEIPTGYKKLLLVRLYYSASSTVTNFVLMNNAVNCDYELLYHDYKRTGRIAVSYYLIDNIKENASVTYNKVGDLFFVYEVK